MFKINKKLLVFLFVSLLLILTACSNTDNSRLKEFNKDKFLMDSSSENPTFDVSSITNLKKLVFNLPDMDSQMCETFPKVIISSIEEMGGVIDASFEYNGHVVTVYYSPDLVSRDEILNNGAYAWVGTVFLSEEVVDLSLAEELYGGRQSNDNLVMPETHMEDVSFEDDLSLINNQDFPSIVSANWLSKNIGNVKVIEIGPESEYLKSHLDNAVGIDLNEIRMVVDEIEKQVIPEDEFKSLIESKGISNNDRIVIYSSASLNYASRLLWTFRFYSHEDVAIVDGGKNSLINYFEFDDIVPDYETSNYETSINHNIYVDSSYIMNELNNPNIILLDVRTSTEFLLGRIPDSININWLDLLNSDNTLKDLSEIKEIYSDLDKNKEIIVYCRSGMRASYSWFVLSEVLDFPNVKVYDGSMIEWNAKGLPIEK